MHYSDEEVEVATCRAIVLDASHQVDLRDIRKNRTRKLCFV